ncbi:MAG: hypothetical protein H8E48_07745 [Chloroflexi bacterium]|nr:hypothetical protein [Chloroflexota bacterium]
MKYTRIYPDADRETHYEEIEEDSKVTEIAPSALMALSKPSSASSVFFADIRVGYTDDFHPPPQKFLVAVLAGEFKTSVSDGEARRFSAGDVVLLDDMDSKGHRSCAIGNAEVKLMFVGLAD